MLTIPFTREDCPKKTFHALIVDELPEIGDRVNGIGTVLEVAPFPPSGPQKCQDIYNYAVWALRLEEKRTIYIALHEDELERL